MTVLDDKLLPGVYDTIDKLGKSLVYVVRTGTAAGDVDWTTGKVEGHTDAAEHTVKSLPPGDYRQWFPEGSDIKAGQLQTGVAGQNLAFDPLAVTEEAPLQVRIDGRAWTVIQIQPIYSGDSICLWLFNCEGGT